MDMLNHLLCKDRNIGGGRVIVACWCALFERGGWTMLKWRVICAGAHDWDGIGSY